MSLFYSVLANPDSKIHEIVKYLLSESSENSRTWSIYVRQLCQLYSIPDPLEMMNGALPSKSSFKELVKTKITVFHENELRSKASTNSKMKYFNVGTKGLNGRHHPVLSNAVTTTEVKALRPVIKMLMSDYFTYSVKNAQSGGGSHCRLCPVPVGGTSPPTEDIEHVLTQCEGTANIRQKKLEELIAVTAMAKSEINCSTLTSNTRTLTQYILDCTSNNLENDVRVSSSDPLLSDIYVTARHMTSAIHYERLKKLKELSKNKNLQ